MNAEVMDAILIDVPHEMRFASVSTGYCVRYECEHCYDEEIYHCPDIERIPTYNEAKANYPLIAAVYAPLDNSR